jgi:phospholipase/carboxylesterase
LVTRHGPAPNAARLTVIAVHGRGAAAANILSVTSLLQLDDLAYVAPNAPGGSWYPKSFLAPFEENEPHLTTALGILETVVDELHAEGVPHQRMAFLGFSQGACLALEFVARHARRYAAVVGFSGGLIGPPGSPRDYSGALDGTRVFLGCSDVDPHIPLARVHESVEVFRRLGGDVTERIYPGLGHTVNDDEIEVARTILGA